MKRPQGHALLTAAVAAGRVGLGLLAVSRPQTVAGPWVGTRHTNTPPVRVLGRAMGGRDLALGVGTLYAMASGQDLQGWILAGAFSDSVDAVATLIAWRHLPRGGRALVLTAAGGAAAAGVLTAMRHPGR